MESFYKANHFKPAAARKRWETMKESFMQQHDINPREIKQSDIDRINELPIEDKEYESLLRDLVQQSLQATLSKDQQKRSAQEKKRQFSLISNRAIDEAGNTTLKMSLKDSLSTCSQCQSK